MGEEFREVTGVICRALWTTGKICSYSKQSRICSEARAHWNANALGVGYQRAEPRGIQYMWPIQLELPFIELGHIFGISCLGTGKEGKTEN